MNKRLIALAALSLAGCYMAPAGADGSDTGGTGAAPPPAPVKLTKARVLTDCEHGKCNAVVSLPPDVVKDAEAAGLVDTDKGAVKYAESLEQNRPSSG